MTDVGNSEIMRRNSLEIHDPGRKNTQKSRSRDKQFTALSSPFLLKEKTGLKIGEGDATLSSKIKSAPHIPDGQSSSTRAVPMVESDDGFTKGLDRNQEALTVTRTAHTTNSLQEAGGIDMGKTYGEAQPKYQVHSSAISATCVKQDIELGNTTRFSSRQAKVIIGKGRRMPCLSQDV